MFQDQELTLIQDWSQGYTIVCKELAFTFFFSTNTFLAFEGVVHICNLLCKKSSVIFRLNLKNCLLLLVMTKTYPWQSPLCPVTKASLELGFKCSKANYLHAMSCQHAFFKIYHSYWNFKGLSINCLKYQETKHWLFCWLDYQLYFAHVTMPSMFVSVSSFYYTTLYISVVTF